MEDTVNANNLVMQFRNCRILQNQEIVKDDLWVSNGTILDPEKVFFDTRVNADIQIDCHNCLISPGFIDVQINGAFGVDFSSPTDHIERGIQEVARGLLSQGVTSFCPTVITSPAETYHKLLPHFKRTEGSRHGAGILGLHLEGPFISKEKKGAHPEEFIGTFDRGTEDLERTYGCLENVGIITLAPELHQSTNVIQYLVSKGITVSIGHSVADLKQGEQAFKCGASFITHLFNAMLSFHHRDPHLVGLLASSKIPPGKAVFYGLIADGIHTHPAALRIAHRTHPKGIVLVTDAIPAMGLPIGTHHMGSQAVTISEKGAYIADTNTLCGSIATMNECVKNFYNMTECTIVEALNSATLHPAQLLGITGKKGTLDFGSDADFVFLDDDLNVVSTYVAGECVWRSPSITSVTGNSL